MRIAGPKELQTRFLYPFRLRKKQVKDVCAALGQVAVSGRGGQSTLAWEAPDPAHLYREELLPHVVNFLFGGSEGNECGYMRLAPAAANMWLNKLEVLLPPRKFQGRREEKRLAVRLLAERIELFLSEYGVGVMSIALALNEKSISFDEALEFNYGLAQNREQTARKLRIPHPSDDREQWEALSADVKARIEQPPAKDAPFRDRLGHSGGEFKLYELAGEILHSMADYVDRGDLQQEFSIYTIAKFDATVDFADPKVRAQVEPFLAALAQVEEPGHAGGSVVANAVLNRCHWFGVGLLGAAHLIADQPPADHPFNSARMPRVMSKYYVPYCLTLLQRFALLRIVADAGDKDYAAANRQLLEFAIRGHFTYVSNREVLHRYYRLCQEGLDVRAGLNDARQAIADLDAKSTVENQIAISIATRDLQAAMEKNVGMVKHIQEIVEWFEIILAAAAAADVWHMFAERPGWFPGWATHLFKDRDSFAAWSVIDVAILFGLIAYLLVTISHRKHDKNPRPQKTD